MEIKANKSFLGSGWSFPVAFNIGNSQLLLTKNDANINEAIDIILKTKLGERLMDSDFGSGMQQFFFRSRDEALKSELREMIMTSLLINEPRITVQEVLIEYSSSDLGRVDITVEYIFNQVNTRHNYVFPFYLNEGTNLRNR